MPKREINEKSLKNLKKFSADYQPSAENKRKGQLKHHQEKRENEHIIMILKRLLQEETTTEQGETVTLKEKMILSLIDSAVNQKNIKAMEYIIDLLNEKTYNPFDIDLFAI